MGLRLHAGAAATGVLCRITGADTTPTIVVTSDCSASNGTTMVSPSVTPTCADDLLVVVMTNSGGNAAFSSTHPTGTTDLGQTQLLDLFQALTAAKELLVSGSATGVRNWTSISPTARQCGTFSIAVKSADAGTATPRPTRGARPARRVVRALSW